MSHAYLDGSLRLGHATLPTNRIRFENQPPDFVTYALCDVCGEYAFRSQFEGWTHEYEEDERVGHRPFTLYVIEEEPC